MKAPRSLVRAHVRGEATDVVRPLLAGAERVVWVGRGKGQLAPGQLRRWLGQTVDALVLDLREGDLDLELLAVGEGLVRAGGRVVLVLDPEGPATGRPPSLLVAPHALADVGRRAFDRLCAAVPIAAALPELPPAPATTGTDETARATAALMEAWRSRSPTWTALLAGRGRGKSSALGAAIRAHSGEVLVSAPSEDALVEVRRFAERALPYVSPLELAQRRGWAGPIVIDEAAQIPVPLLRAVARAHPDAHFAWASTDHGYEGTGQGLVLRFLAWAKERGPLVVHRLREPIRFASDDPVEAAVARLFALDATLPELPAAGEVRIEHAAPDRLARDEALLREVVALLSWAHYRTAPGDVLRLLDAPNLRVVLAREGQHVVGVNVIAREGGLDEAAAARATRVRLRGQGLADTLASHAGHPEAATMSLVRSVRLAVHPARRRQGIARRLVEHVEATEPAELYGTLFGATEALVSFRQRLGYQVVRLGMRRGERSGEPSVVMARARSPRAEALVAALREELARQLPSQLVLLGHEGELEPGLVRALQHDLPVAPDLDEAALRARLLRYVASAQPVEAVVAHVARWAALHPERLARLETRARALVEGRAIERRAWPEVAARAGLRIPEAHRQIRAAVRALVE